MKSLMTSHPNQTTLMPIRAGLEWARRRSEAQSTGEAPAPADVRPDRGTTRCAGSQRIKLPASQIVGVSIGAAKSALNLVEQVVSCVVLLHIGVRS